MKNFNQIAKNVLGKNFDNNVNFLSGYFIPYENTPNHNWPANKPIFGLIGRQGNNIIAIKIGSKEYEKISLNNCYFPQKVGDTIKVDLKYMMLVGTKDGIPQYREVSYCRAIAK